MKLLQSAQFISENIIMWRELDGVAEKDYALSFQEPSGCLFIW